MPPPVREKKGTYNTARKRLKHKQKRAIISSTRRRIFVMFFLKRGRGAMQRVL